MTTAWTTGNAYTVELQAYPSTGVTVARRPHLGERERVNRYRSGKGGKRRR